MSVTVHIVEPGAMTPTPTTGRPDMVASVGNPVGAGLVTSVANPVRHGGSSPDRFSARSAGRGRRLAGIAVLVLALAGVVAVGQAAAQTVAGHPVADWPLPPAVGSCLDLDAGHPRAVPCSGPHDAEVTRAFGPLNPMATATSQGPLYVACEQAGAGYLGTAARASTVPGRPDWDYLPLTYSTRPVTAPPDQRAGRYGWVVCVVEPAIPVRYVGTVHRVPVTAAPAAYRTCLDDSGQAVSCVLPHTQEVLAALNSSVNWGWEPVIRIGVPPVPGSDSMPTSGRTDLSAQQLAQLAARLARAQSQASDSAGWLSQCQQLAGTLAGTTDPTYGGAIGFGVGQVPAGISAVSGTVTVVVQGAEDQPPDPGADGLPPPSTLVTVTPQVCVAQALGARPLADSLVGRGDASPLAGG
jgi:hypothetical protein